MSDEELKHYGVLGMKWGKRRAMSYRTKAKEAKSLNDMSKANKYNSKARKIENKIAKQKEKDKAWVKDNDRRVKQYGKDNVQRANIIQAATILYASHKVGTAISKIGGTYCKQMRNNPSVSRGKERVAAGMALIGLAGVTAYAVSSTRKLAKDYKLADEYDSRKKKKNNI